MANNKLSISNVSVNQGLAQIKTGEFFVITEIDLEAKKATLKNANGEEKVVGKATLERWYRELSADEVVAFGKMLKSISAKEGASDVQESNEPEKAEQVEDSADADTENASDEAESETAETGEDEPTDTNESGTGDSTSANQNSAGRSDEFVGGDDATGGGDNPSDASEIASPVTPSNAGKDKDKSKEGKKDSESAKKNAALMKVRQTIIDTILADSPSIKLNRTTSYDVLKEKNNFAEITRGTNRFNVSVMSKSLTPDQINKVKINPASFGWSIDADFTVFDEGDIEMAVQLIRQSREYRLAHPVTRKKKETAAEKK